MSKYLFLFFSSFISYSTHAQNQHVLAGNSFFVTPISEINWKLGNIKPIKSISVAINDKVILLSESDHGDGSAIEAECMILKNLIDSNKLDVIFIESSWISVNDIVEILKIEGVSGISKTYDYMRDYGLRYWVDNGFWEFLCKKIIEGRVKLFGFDIDGVSPKSINSMFNEAINLDTTKIYIANNSIDYENIKFQYDHFDGWGLQSRYEIRNYLKQKKFIEPLINYYLSVNNTKRSNQWKSILNFFYWMAKRSEVLKDNKYSNQIEGDRQGVQFNAVRDSLMADIFYDYYSKNKNAKTVAIMSAYHALKYPEEIKDLQECCLDSKVKSIGEILTKKYNLDFYNVCFISSAGKYGIDYFGHAKYLKITKPIVGSIEYDLKKMEYNYSFVEFKDTKINSFYMNVFFDKYFKSDWSRNFSAAFFIKEMQPLIFKNLVKK
jgi:hypothetical protein